MEPWPHLLPSWAGPAPSEPGGLCQLAAAWGQRTQPHGSLMQLLSAQQHWSPSPTSQRNTGRVISSDPISGDLFLSLYALVLITLQSRTMESWYKHYCTGMRAAAGFKINLGLKFPVFPHNTWRSFPGLCYQGLVQEDLKGVTRFTIKCSPCSPSRCMWAPAPLALLYLGTCWPLLLIYPLKVHFQTKMANFQHAVMCFHHP